MPPSTFSSFNATPESAFMASTTSRVCHAVASSAARAMWPLVTYRVSPTIAPRASLLHHGRLPDQPQVVPQPLHEGAGDGDGAFEAVHGGLAADLVPERRQQAALGLDGC